MAHPYGEAWRWQHHAAGIFFSGGNWETSQDQGKDGAKNREILDENLLQSAQDLRLRRRFPFQQDNIPKQTVRKIQELLGDKSLNVHERPIQSPDLNLI